MSIMEFFAACRDAQGRNRAYDNILNYNRYCCAILDYTSMVFDRSHNLWSNSPLAWLVAREGTMQAPVTSLFALTFLLTTTLASQAQRSSDLAKSDPKKTYFALKQSMKDNPPKDFLDKETADEIEANADLAPNTAWILPCDYAYGSYGINARDKVTQALADLATAALYLEDEIEDFPENVSHPLVRKWEKIRINEIERGIGLKPWAHKKWFFSPSDRAELRTIARKLNAYRKTHPQKPKNYPLVVATPEGCGAGEITVFIETEPAAKRIQYISLHLHAVCKGQGIAETDSARCNHWRDVSLNSKYGTELSGRYKLMITWNDGSVADRDLDVDSLGQDSSKRHFKISK